MPVAAKTFGLIIIGDEILSGKRQDRHLPHLLELLAARGLQLAWVQIIGDDPQRITATLRQSMASGDVVFCCGGIGATPDDHTRQCAAHAAGLPLALHPEACANIDERISEMARAAGLAADLACAEHQQRRQMAVFPEGATLIPNSYNRIAGFSVGTHHFLPGFPVMAGPMMAWVLDHLYRDQFHLVARAEQSMLVYGIHESALAPWMAAVEARYPQVKAFSLPHVGEGGARAHIEFGVKGDPVQTAAAFAQLCSHLDGAGAEYAPLPAHGAPA
ncbi:competence/damage-inducible protein A [Massilia sp. PAMC28688]|uniref:competence/damage-inducible protein A n=1 Tax=Massilia sp. PAMC28688 TaxID=2861283 RepID=UPI001C6336DC|nr:molybdopterin-binding protein [Massilia sp. PAMC28688]QYF94258.1 competence/damage-inducible protein A [Massilia sp. PAMC28688]